MAKADFPFGSEFSPSQLDLATVLDIAATTNGIKALQDALQRTYFNNPATSEGNRETLAYNASLGMRAYGVIDAEGNLTNLGHALHANRDDKASLYAAFAKHILNNHLGATLVQVLQDMHASGENITLVAIRRWLEERGISLPRGNKHTSTMKLWLQEAGVLSDDYRVNEQRLQEVLGIAPQEIEALAALSPEQRAFLKTLARMDTPGPYPSNEIEKLATATYGIQFNEKSLPRQVLHRLQQLEYITIEQVNRSRARMITSTHKLQGDVVAPLIEQFERQIASDIRPLLRKPLGEILEELRAEDRHIRGLALEALAFKLMRLIDLTYVKTRLRGAATGGAEVDVVFESARLVFSRWQVQCKNTDRVSLEDVAKEVGLTHLLKSNVVAMVSTGDIGGEARKYANKVMTDSNLCIVMIDRSDIEQIERHPAAIVDVLGREAGHAMKIKAIDPRDEVPDATGEL